MFNICRYCDFICLLRYFPPVGGGGPIGQTSETTLPVEFSDKNCTIDRVRQIMHIGEKKMKKVFLTTYLVVLVFMWETDCDQVLLLNAFEQPPYLRHPYSILRYVISRTSIVETNTRGPCHLGPFVVVRQYRLALIIIQSFVIWDTIFEI